MIPGVAIGTTESIWISPAFPNDVPVPGSSRSTRVTENPDLCSETAQQSPTTPAPSTVKCCFLSVESGNVAISLADYLTRMHIYRDEVQSIDRQMLFNTTSAVAYVHKFMKRA